ncbi:MAG: hypothetical protein ACTSPI_16740 [Candidatus Heimdallarchaeaceae archaeon]
MNQKEIIEKAWNNHLDWLIKETKKVFKRDSDLFTPKIEVILSSLLFKLVSDFIKLSKKSTINAIEEALSRAEDNYQNRLARAERMSRQGLMERDKQISELEEKYNNQITSMDLLANEQYAIIGQKDKQIQSLKKKIELLEIDEKTNLDDFEKLQNAHEKLRRQINCVKDHPEIKPLNCCWMADSLELRELRKIGKLVKR